WPFVPRPAVLPPRPPVPRPTRFARLFAPGAGFRSWSFMVRLDLFHLGEVRHLCEHAADLGAVRERVRLADAAETEGAEGAALVGLRPDGRAGLRDLQHHLTSVYSTGPRSLSLYASSRPFGTNSSADRPRSRATSSGRFRLCRPWMVARATLMWLA